MNQASNGKSRKRPLAADVSLAESNLENPDDSKLKSITKHSSKRNKASSPIRSPSPSSRIAIVPFHIEYPDTSSRERQRRGQRKGSIDHGQWESKFATEGLSRLYVVHPQREWSRLKQFTKCKIGDHSFKKADYVFINHSDVEHGQDLSDMSEKAFWIGRILEIRGRDSEHVYIRLYWLYWREELPGGPRAYHSKFELIASNHMEVIDAMTITGSASVEHFIDGRIDQMALKLPKLFWRQTVDFSTCEEGELSALTTHCTCKQPWIPGKYILWCPDCHLWLHKQCILQDHLHRVWKILGHEYIKPDAPPPSSSSDEESSSSWEDFLKAEILPMNDSGPERHMIYTTELEKKQPRQWLDEPICPACHECLN